MEFYNLQARHVAHGRITAAQEATPNTQSNKKLGVSPSSLNIRITKSKEKC